MTQTIFIVDSSENFSEKLKENFKINGFESKIFHDGKSAFEAIGEEVPRAMCIFVGVPVINGYKLSQLIKYNEKLKDISIVLMVSSVQKKDEEKLLQSKADGFIERPSQVTQEFCLELFQKLMGNKNWS